MACGIDVVLGITAPVDPIVHIGFCDLPRVPVDQPVVGLLDLPAVVDLLVEDAELVADAVPDGGALEGGERVEITRRQPSEAAVAQPRFLLAGQHVVEVLAEFAQRSACCLLDAEVEQVAAQLRPHQELGRQVAGHLPAEIQRRLRGRHPVVLHAVADRKGKGPVIVLGPQRGRRATDRVAQMVDDSPPQRVGGQAGAAALEGGGVGVLDDVSHCRSVTEIDV